jgi:hypothetical protein
LIVRSGAHGLLHPADQRQSVIGRTCRGPVSELDPDGRRAATGGVTARGPDAAGYARVVW